MTQASNVPASTAAPGIASFMRLFAHELGNPIATIRMSSEMLLADIAADMRQQLSQMILDEALHLEGLIESAVYYASLGQVTPIEIDVDQLFETVVHQIASTVPVYVKNNGPVGTVYGDAPQLARMVRETIQNAIDAGASRVDVSAEIQGEQLVITVSDDGEGVANPGSIFDPFYTTREGKLGLGMSIAIRIATLHNGSVEAAPGATGGTVVTIRIQKNS